MRREAIMMLATSGLWMQGCKATPPGRIETAVMTSAKHSLVVGNKSARNPIAYAPQTLADGKEAFTHYCVACHGLDGQNTGVPFADHMTPPVPSLASKDVQSYTDGQLKWVIDNGVAPQPACGIDQVHGAGRDLLIEAQFDLARRLRQHNAVARLDRVVNGSAETLDNRRAKPIASMPCSTAAGGADPAVIIAMVRPTSRRSSAGALSSRLATTGAPQRWVTPSRTIASKIAPASTRRRQTCVPARAVMVQGKHQPLQWNIGRVQR